MALNSRHVLWDLWFESSSELTQPDAWQACLVAAAEAAGATILHQQFHRFQPGGFTGYLLLAESHISIHTWPEDQFAALDLFTCGSMDTKLILQAVRQRFEPAHEELQDQARGALSAQT